MQILLQQLEKVRSQARGLLVLMRLSHWLAAVLAVALAAGLLDYLLRLPGWLRLIGLVAGVGAGLFWIARALQRSLSARPALTALALRLERMFPATGGQLASGVAFATGDVDAPMNAPLTREMAATVTHNAQNLVDAGQVRKLLDLRRTGRAVGMFLAAAGLMTTIAVAKPDEFSIASQRWLMPLGQTNWPAWVSLADVTEKSVRPTNAAIPLSVKIERGDSSGLRTWARYRHINGQGVGGEWKMSLMTRQQSAAGDTAGLYSLLVEGQTGARKLEYVFEAGDGVTLPGELSMYDPPVLKGLEAQVQPPAYAAKFVPAEQVDMLNPPRPVATMGLWAGSKLKLGMTIHGSLKMPGVEDDAAMRRWAHGALAGIIDGGGEMGPQDLTVRRAAGSTADQHKLEVELTVRKPMQIRMSLPDEYGQNHPDHRLFQFEVRPDAQPRVYVSQPAADESVLPTAKLKVAAISTDDVAVEKLKLEATGASAEPVIHWEKSGEASTPAKVEGELNIADLKVKPGDQVTILARAQDNYDLDGQRHPEVLSAPRRLLVISESQLSQQVRAQLAELRQQAMRAELEQRILVERGRVDEAAATGQRSVTERTEQMARAVDALVNRVESNELNDPQIHRVLEDAGKLIDEARQAAGQAAGDINSLIRSEDTGSKANDAARPGDQSKPMPGDNKPGDMNQDPNQKPGSEQPGSKNSDSKTGSNAKPGDSQTGDSKPGDQPMTGDKGQENPDSRNGADQKKPGGRTPNENGDKPSDASPMEKPMPGDNKPGEQGADQKKPGENEASDNKPGDNKSGDNKTGQDQKKPMNGGKSPMGQSGDQKPGDQKSGDQKPGDQQSGDQKPGDQASGDQKPGQPKPMNGKQAQQQAKSGEKTPQQKQADVKKNQEKAADLLADVADVLDQGKDAFELKQQVKGLADQQRQIADRVKELMPKTVGQTADQLPKDQKNELKQLTAEQKELAEKVKALLEKMRQTSAALSQQAEKPSEQAAAQALQQAADTATQQDLQQKMEQAAQQVDQNQLAGAEQDQQSAQSTMQQMMNQMEQQEKLAQQILQRKLDQLQEAVERLVQQQAGHLDRFNLAEKIDGLDEPLAGLRRNTLAVSEQAALGGQKVKPAARLITDAAEHQGLAVVAIRAKPAKRDEARTEQENSLQALNDALDMIRKLSDENQQQEQEEQLKKLLAEYRKVLEQQKAVTNASDKHVGVKADERSRKWRADSLKLANDQADARVALSETGKLVGPAVVYQSIHEQLDSQAAEVVGHLRDGSVDEKDIFEQQMIVAAIESLIESIEKTGKKQDPFATPKQPKEEGQEKEEGGEQGKQAKPKVVPDGAQLKALRARQSQIKKMTELVHGRSYQSENLKSKMIESLGLQQADLAEAAMKLLKSMQNQQQQAPGAKPE